MEESKELETNNPVMRNQSSGQKLLLHVTLTPGLGRLHFFDFLNIEEVVRLQWVCKETKLIKELIPDLQQINISQTISIPKIQDFFPSRKVKGIVLHKVDGLMDYITFPFPLHTLSVINCSGINVNVCLHHITRLILRNKLFIL